ncbi:hypothetical protein GQ457_01G017030 [Hibiscus cannabinus]
MSCLTHLYSKCESLEVEKQIWQVILNDNQHDMEVVVGCKNQDGESAIVVAETQLGDVDANSNEFNWYLDCFTTVRVRALHVSSSTFSGKSLLLKFCLKGIRISKQCHETIQISISKEVSTARPALLDVLRVADQIMVASSKRCSNVLLHNSAMTLESTMFYLELIPMGEAIQPFIDATKQYFIFYYKVSSKRGSFVAIHKNRVVIFVLDVMLYCTAYPQRTHEDESLKSENQHERKGMLYQSLKEERNKLKAHFEWEKSLHAEVMMLYHEFKVVVNNIEECGIALREKETNKVQHELKAAEFQIETVVQEFEIQLQIIDSEEFNALIRKSRFELDPF